LFPDALKKDGDEGFSLKREREERNDRIIMTHISKNSKHRDMFAIPKKSP
jgi:hypothetical protein